MHLFSTRTLLMVGLIFLTGAAAFSQSKSETIDFIIEIDDGKTYSYGKMVGKTLKLTSPKGLVDQVENIARAKFDVSYDGYFIYYVYDKNYSSATWAAAGGSPTWMLDSRSEAESLVKALQHLKQFAKASAF